MRGREKQRRPAGSRHRRNRPFVSSFFTVNKASHLDFPTRASAIASLSTSRRRQCREPTRASSVSRASEGKQKGEAARRPTARKHRQCPFLRFSLQLRTAVAAQVCHAGCSLQLRGGAKHFRGVVGARGTVADKEEDKDWI